MLAGQHNKRNQNMPLMKRKQPIDHFIEVNNINLHYLEYESEGPILLLMHGLTANAHAFDKLAADGLYPGFRLICPDLRGRGLSDHPAFCYSFEDHAQDILGLIDHLGEKQVFLGGHSYGGYLGIYIAANYPNVVKKLVILDAAARMNPRALEMLGNAIGRLSTEYKSFDDYIATVKKAPYLTFWDDGMLSYYRADVKDLPDGKVRPRSNIADIYEISMGTANIDWEYYIRRVAQPAILINGVDSYNLGEPLLPDTIAKDTVEMMKDAQYVPVDGNHQTMLYGRGAQETVAAISAFLLGEAQAHRLATAEGGSGASKPANH
jgi:pimeloyl-ACP methyl ester carboxylesterase